VHEVFERPAHPYTLGLQAAMPSRLEGARARLEPIEGSPPDLFAPPPGCAYFERCPWAMRVCGPQGPPLWTVEGDHASRCWLHHEAAAARAPAALHRGRLMGAGA
jgi:oligopeptide/dipeptide ABC transporter ATP-binding protein